MASAMAYFLPRARARIDWIGDAAQTRCQPVFFLTIRAIERRDQVLPGRDVPVRKIGVLRQKRHVVLGSWLFLGFFDIGGLGLLLLEPGGRWVSSVVVAATASATSSAALVARVRIVAARRFFGRRRVVAPRFDIRRRGGIADFAFGPIAAATSATSAAPPSAPRFAVLADRRRSRLHGAFFHGWGSLSMNLRFLDVRLVVVPRRLPSRRHLNRGAHGRLIFLALDFRFLARPRFFYLAWRRRWRRFHWPRRRRGRFALRPRLLLRNTQKIRQFTPAVIRLLGFVHSVTCLSIKKTAHGVIR
jgi:hypothetical protein